MHILSHLSYPTLAFIGASSVLGNNYSWEHLVLLEAASVLPDMDFFYQKLVKKGSIDETFQHHNWLSHRPIVYSPLILLFLLKPSLVTFIIMYGVCSHFVLDTFFCGDGMAWFYPFSKRLFSFLSTKTQGCHGKKWESVYKELPIFKVDITAFVLLLFMLGKRYF